MKALIFDLDDTLYNQIQPFQRAVHRSLQVSDDLLEALYLAFRNRADQVFEASVSGAMTMKDMHTYRMKAAFADMGIALSDQEAYALQETYAHEQGHLELAPGSQDLFVYCQENDIPLGLITNGPHLHQLRKIQALKLKNWIPEDATLISGQLGITKPNPQIFHLMEQRLGLEPAELCYVGDSFENDIVGAKAAGWQAIWFNHRQRTAPDSKLADMTVTDFATLQTWLEATITPG